MKCAYIERDFEQIKPTATGVGWDPASSSEEGGVSTGVRKRVAVEKWGQVIDCKP